MGFTFDNTSQEASPIADMHHLILKNPKNQERIFPYIGGSEVNTSPTHEPHRYVINFAEMDELEAGKWPELVEILEQKVKPERSRLNQNNADGRRRAQKWWLWGRYTPALFRAISSCKIVLAISRVSPHGAFTFLPAGMVYSEQLIVFALEEFAALCVLQSRVHELWARFFSGSALDLIRYAPSDCFETFPFPVREAGAEHLNWEADSTLEAVGKTYYEYRAVLNAYGWHDINTTCGFALDYLDTDPDDLPPVRDSKANALAQDRIASGDLFFPTPDEAAAFDSIVRTGKRKLPWRYKWPEATHDEVLDRLLDLNQKRHLEEVRGGKSTKPNAPHNNKNSDSRRKQHDTDVPTLFDLEEYE